ncbi:MAG TPA: hypothetical protein PKW95_02150 [bacterium]|nr:hypothetical protein [bacterium]
MPIEKMYTEAMLNPFRDMLRDCEAKQLSGPDFDKMRECLGLMERYAEEMNDFAAYSGRLAQEMLFQKFSDAYSRLLSAAAQGNSSAEPNDEGLLEQTLSAYEQSLQTYRSGQAGDAGTKLIPTMESIIALGRSGISYPVFLRRMEEGGLARALEGAAPVVRDALLQEVAFAHEAWLPRTIEKTEKKLALFDRLAAAAPFGQPQPIEFEIGCVRIDHGAEPGIVRWDAIVRRWNRLLEMLVDWVDSFTGFAPTDERWMPMGGGDPWPNIMRTRECGPGDFRRRETIFHEYFNLTWDDIFLHETFLVEYTARRVHWSDERLRLIRATYDHCRPGQTPPQELIRRAEELHPAKDLRPERFQPPPWGTEISAPDFIEG